MDYEYSEAPYLPEDPGAGARAPLAGSSPAAAACQIPGSTAPHGAPTSFTSAFASSNLGKAGGLPEAEDCITHQDCAAAHDQDTLTGDMHAQPSQAVQDGANAANSGFRPASAAQAPGGPRQPPLDIPAPPLRATTSDVDDLPESSRSRRGTGFKALAKRPSLPRIRVVHAGSGDSSPVGASPISAFPRPPAASAPEGSGHSGRGCSPERAHVESSPPQLPAAPASPMRGLAGAGRRPSRLKRCSTDGDHSEVAHRRSLSQTSRLSPPRDHGPSATAPRPIPHAVDVGFDLPGGSLGTSAARRSGVSPGGLDVVGEDARGVVPGTPGFAAKRRHYLVLSEAGRPIWTRYGDEASVAATVAVVQGLMSYAESMDDELRSVECGDGRCIAFRRCGPLLLVGSSCADGPAAVSRHLGLLHDMIVLLLGHSFLHRMERSPGFDVARLLQDAGGLLAALVDAAPWSPGALLDAVQPLPLPRAARAVVSGALLGLAAQHGRGNIVAGALLCGPLVVACGAVGGAGGLALHPRDLFLLTHFALNNDAMRHSESFVPIGLPASCPGGAMVHAYMRYVDRAADVVVIYLCSEVAGFSACSDAARALSMHLDDSGTLAAILRSACSAAGVAPAVAPPGAEAVAVSADSDVEMDHDASEEPSNVSELAALRHAIGERGGGAATARAPRPGALRQRGPSATRLAPCAYSGDYENDDEDGEEGGSVATSVDVERKVKGAGLYASSVESHSFANLETTGESPSQAGAGRSSSVTMPRIGSLPAGIHGMVPRSTGRMMAVCSGGVSIVAPRASASEAPPREAPRCAGVPWWAHGAPTLGTWAMRPLGAVPLEAIPLGTRGAMSAPPPPAFDGAPSESLLSSQWGAHAQDWPAGPPLPLPQSGTGLLWHYMWVTNGQLSMSRFQHPLSRTAAQEGLLRHYVDAVRAMCPGGVVPAEGGEDARLVTMDSYVVCGIVSGGSVLLACVDPMTDPSSAMMAARRLLSWLRLKQADVFLQA
ncbi:unnamed protein product [Pedinophyceae sp. YPF-701]|nr:unnamed protein product [Pedinophyceae sp. YPF-701]